MLQCSFMKPEDLLVKGILEYLEDDVKCHPNKTAIVYGEKSYSFLELSLLSRRIGAALAKRTGAGRPVAVMVNRSAEIVAAFLGTAYNGDYYIAVDPSMNPDRIRAILTDSGAEIILGTEENLSLLEQLNVTASFVDYSNPGDEQADAPEVESRTPLYMVYTSGSTGTPKGILKSHGAVMSFIQAFTQVFPIGTDEIIGNQTPMFFDASAKDIYLMLYSGLTLDVIPSELFTFPPALLQYLNEHKITYICWVPTALSMVVQMNTFRKILPETLRHVFFVGEVFPLKQLKVWISALPGLQYVNLFGSSEISGVCCYYEIDSNAVPDSIPIGKALPNCEVYLQGENGFITQPDEVGEVVIASEALALEYYGDPQKTAEHFVIRTTPSGKVGRVFLSGDLARYDGEGNFVFVSRKDFQIKYLGKRIELGEIESAADKIPQIQRCCCLFDSEKKAIKLYCEMIPDSDLDAPSIRKLLRDRLPDYMVPHKVIILKEMPFNANGKINRKALAEF